MTTVKVRLEADCATVPDPIVGDEKLFRTLLTVTESFPFVNACALLMLVVDRASPTRSRERLMTNIFFVCITGAFG